MLHQAIDVRKKSVVQEESSALPCLIFAELHNNPSTAKTLNLLLPELIKLGYKNFLDETPTNTTLDSMISSMEKAIDTFTNMEKDFKQKELNIYDDNDIVKLVDKESEDDFQAYKKHILLYNSDILKTIDEKELDARITAQIQKENAQTVLTIKTIITQYPPCIPFKSFLEAIKENHKVHYHGIDDRDELKLNAEIDTQFKKTLSLRDSSMATKYAQTPDAFGRIGLLHAEGIHQTLLEKKSSHIIFHIYSGSTFSKEPEVEALETRVRAGSTPIIPINGEQSEDKIIETIIGHILAKQKEKISIAPTSTVISSQIGTLFYRSSNLSDNSHYYSDLMKMSSLS